MEKWNLHNTCQKIEQPNEVTELKFKFLTRFEY